MIRKHSVSLHGHRTSLSLEEPFWQELKAIAVERDMSLAALIAEIDEARESSTNLSSALRLHVLDVLKSGKEQRRVNATAYRADAAPGL
ncbi:ribbon-helix-helix domain-containing protein [Pseudomonas sp. R2.Fl]|nr:ribbon-helix-helix domain-containing protein [Pseudomonas sp. R2.Fl]